MRKTVLTETYKLAKKDKRVVFVGSDLGAGTLDEFKKEMPERFFMEGVSEQHIIGQMAGMATNGKIPFFNTIAVFLTRRCLEQIIIDVALPNLPVRLLGSGGGLVYAPLGPTHLAIDDISIMRGIPNMTILVPADATEMERLMPQTLEHRGPIYIRIAKGGDPVVTPPDMPCIIGRGMPMKKGEDVLLISTGTTLQLAIEAASILKLDSIDAAVLHMPTIKPFDRELVVDMAAKVRGIVTIEEAFVHGGLGSVVSEVVADARYSKPKPILRIGIPDVFPDKYGSQSQLLAYYGITTERVVDAAKRLIGNETTMIARSNVRKKPIKR